MGDHRTSTVFVAGVLGAACLVWAGACGDKHPPDDIAHRFGFDERWRAAFGANRPGERNASCRLAHRRNLSCRAAINAKWVELAERASPPRYAPIGAGAYDQVQRFFIREFLLENREVFTKRLYHDRWLTTCRAGAAREAIATRCAARPGRCAAYAACLERGGWFRQPLAYLKEGQKPVAKQTPAERNQPGARLKALAQAGILSAMLSCCAPDVAANPSSLGKPSTHTQVAQDACLARYRRPRGCIEAIATEAERNSQGGGPWNPTERQQAIEEQRVALSFAVAQIAARDDARVLATCTMRGVRIPAGKLRATLERFPVLVAARGCASVADCGKYAACLQRTLEMKPTVTTKARGR